MTRYTPLLALLYTLPAAADDAPERVIMPLDDFMKVYEAAKNRPDEPENAPIHHTLSSARYAGQVVLDDGEPVSATFDATFRVEILKKEGWKTVPLLPASVAVASAKIGGVDAPLVIQGGKYVLVTDRTGALDIRVKFATSVFTSEGQSGLSFELLGSGATTMTLAVPSSDALDFEVANARIQTDRVVGSRRLVEATLPGTGALSVTWSRELPEAETLDPRVYAEVYSLVSVGDGLLTARATIQHTILFAGVDELKVDLPDEMTLLNVGGAGIRDWSVTGGELTVQLAYEAEGVYALDLELEKVVGGGSQDLAMPLPVPVGVERSKGWLGVEARGNLEVAAGAVRGATVIDVRALPASIVGITDQPVLLGFKYLDADTDIALKVEQHDDVDVLVTLLDQVRATTMWTRDGRRLTSVRYQVRNNRKQYLRLEMPAGAELWSASVAGRAAQPARAGDGRMLIPLVRSNRSGGALAAFDVEVVYVEDAAAPTASGTGTFAATLPSADVPTTYVAWTVYTPADAKLSQRSFHGSLRKVELLSDPIPASDVAYIQTATPQMAADAAAQSPGGDGATPVQVRLPVEGVPVHFEKLLALQEGLNIAFSYRGLRD